LNNLNFEKITESLINVFLEAGQITKDISKKGIEITIKPDKSPVTNADLAVDKILSTKIKNLTPEIPIISEESVDLDHKNSLLTKNIDLDFIEILIREKFLFGKKDETTYIIKENGNKN